MSLGPNQVLGNLLSDAVDPHSWRTKKMLCEEDEAETEASGVPKCAVLIYHLLAHLESPMWPTQACGSIVVVVMVVVVVVVIVPQYWVGGGVAGWYGVTHYAD